jgi:hypothetical protein
MSQLIEEYTVYAHSHSLNQEVRQFNIEGSSTGSFKDRMVAEQWAKAFAQSLNTQKHQHTDDWQARVKLEQLGADTFVLNQNSAR